MAYGKLKCDTLTFDNSGSDVDVTVTSLNNKADLASPTFTGTVTITTASAGDNSTKAASTAFVTTSFATKADPLFTGSIEFNGQLKESVVVSAGKLSDASNLDLSAGNVFLFTVTESTTSTPNLRYDGSTTLGSKMAVGDCLSVTIITTANSSAFSAQLTIDGNAVTENWTGGSAPNTGGTSGYDIHAYTIMKKGSSGTYANDYAVIANHSMTS